MPERKDERLDSWKEIADYLKRDVGTAIRWEKERGLPVHRAPGGKRKVVFAYRCEINEWLSSANDEKAGFHQDLNSLLTNNCIHSANGPESAPASITTTLSSPEMGSPAQNGTLPVPLLSTGVASAPVSAISAHRAHQLDNRWLYAALFLSILATLGMAAKLVLDRRSPKFQISGTALVMPDPRISQYDFEDGEQGWVVRPKMMIRRIFSSDTHHWQGNRSLAIVFDGPYARKSQIYVVHPPIAAGRAVTAHVWCPAKNQFEAVALFVEDGENTWSNDWQAFSSLIPGSWNKLVVRIPSDAVTPLSRLGLEFTASAPWKGTCYLDAINW